jgi:hypothetical protein
VIGETLFQLINKPGEQRHLEKYILDTVIDLITQFFNSPFFEQSSAPQVRLWFDLFDSLGF